jgi:hypothetical protein
MDSFAGKLALVTGGVPHTAYSVRACPEGAYDHEELARGRAAWAAGEAEAG